MNSVIRFLLLAVVSSTAYAVKLNESLVSGGDVRGVEISADGSIVVYRADQKTDEIYDVYSVPIDGGAVIKLTDSAGFTRIIGISPDSNTVILQIDGDLYSVPIRGGELVKLSETLAAGRGIRGRVEISPDSTTIVYAAEQDAVGVTELYSVPIRGGDITKLNQPLAGRAGVGSFSIRISADSSTVVYRVANNATVRTGVELFSVPIRGGIVTRLNSDLVLNGNVGSVDYQLSADSNYVVYRADQDTDDVDELYSVPIRGGAVVKLNETIVPGGGVRSGYRISPDSGTVVYPVQHGSQLNLRLFSVPIRGGNVTELDGANNIGNAIPVQISPNGNTVVYNARRETTGPFSLYSVPLRGGSVTKLINAIDRGTGSFLISRDSSTVVFPLNRELYSVRIGGGNIKKLSGNNIVQFRIDITPNNTVVYEAGPSANNILGVYSVSSEGGPAVMLNEPLVAGGNIWNTLVDPNGSFAVYVAEQDTDEVYELYSVAIPGAFAPRQIPTLSRLVAVALILFVVAGACERLRRRMC